MHRAAFRSRQKFGAFGPKKAAPAPEATPIDLFSKRNEQPTAAGADALLHQRAEEALNRTVINDVPRAAPTPEDFARHIEQHAVEVKVGDYKVEWTEKWGPYKDNRLLLADIFKQIAAREFDVSKFDANAKFKGWIRGAVNGLVLMHALLNQATAFNKVWCAILGWPTEIVSGARAVKEIDGVGKSAGEKIDKILKDVRPQTKASDERNLTSVPCFRNVSNTATSSFIPWGPWTFRG